MDETLDQLLVIFTITISAATGVENFYYKFFFAIQEVQFHDPQNIFYIVSTIFVCIRIYKTLFTKEKKK